MIGRCGTWLERAWTGTYGDFGCLVDVWRVVLWCSCVRKQNSVMMGARRHTKSGSAENLGYCDMLQVPHPTCCIIRGCFDNVSDAGRDVGFSQQLTPKGRQVVHRYDVKAYHHGWLDMLVLMIYLMIRHRTPLPAMPPSRS